MALALFYRHAAAAHRCDHDRRGRRGHMRSSTAAALVGAGALSTLAGPLHGLRMRRIAALKRAESPGTEDASSATAAIV